MIIRRIGLGSLDLGLYEAGEDLVKGRVVCLKSGKIVYPTATTDVALGFVNGAIDTNEGSDLDYDVVKKGKKVTVQTLVKNNMFATTEYDGTLASGDELTFEVNTGKVIKAVAETTADALFVCDSMSKAGGHDFCELFVK